MRFNLLAAMTVTAAVVAAAPAVAAPFKSERLSVTVEGTGPDVILVPGLTSNPRIFRETIAAVPGYRYHLVHVAGFSGAPAGANADGPVAAPVAEEIARYIREAKLQKPALVGHSMGGTMAMMVAARHPEVAGKLMVVDMVPYMGALLAPPGTSPEALRAIADANRARALNAPREAGAQAMAAMIGTMVTSDAVRPALVADATSSDQATVANAFHELTVTDLRPELARISAPATVLFVRPPTVPLTDAQMEGFYAAAFASLKGATLKRIPDSRHFIMYDAPQRFREELKTFLAN
jgi:pimeloyl-ACP methyl ester carboxylesterase